jgi:uncharacterized protein YndB with AHSA1/START domain
MPRTTYSIEINRPVNDVFRYIDSAEHVTKWLSGLVKIIPITEGGNRVGARARHVYNENGRTFEMEEETLAYEPNHRVKIRAVGDAFELTAEYTLTAVGNRTRLDFETDLTFRNILLRLLGPLFGGSSKKRVEQDFQRLKALVESA